MREIGLLVESEGGQGVACAVRPDDRSMTSASEDQTLKLWDLATGCA